MYQGAATIAATPAAIASTIASRTVADGRYTARHVAKMPAKTTPTSPFVRIDKPSATPARIPEVQGASAARRRHSAATHMNGTRPTSWTATSLTPIGSSIAVSYTHLRAHETR